MAHSDIATGRIYGCKKGSLTWWHEKGHIVFNRSLAGSSVQMSQTNWFVQTLVWTVAGLVTDWWILKWAAACTLLVFLGLYFYEEAWCWVYAWKHRGKR